MHIYKQVDILEAISLIEIESIDQALKPQRRSIPHPLVWAMGLFHDDVIKWKHFPSYCPFVRGIHRSPVNSPHKGQWRGALMFSLICASNQRLSKQSWCWWFETQSRSLWRHSNVPWYNWAVLPEVRNGCTMRQDLYWTNSFAIVSTQQSLL